MALQNLKLGLTKTQWFVHEDAQRVFERDHKLCLVSKGLKPYHLNPAGIKVTLSKIWQLVGKVEGQVNDDGTANFYFNTKHHILMVMEKAPYTYRGWLVDLDRWSNKGYHYFLKYIPFKIKILKLPNVYQRPEIVNII